MIGGRPATGAVLRWPVHPSFLNYLHRLDDFNVTVTGEASYEADTGITVKGSSQGYPFDTPHGVVLRAHNGALELHLEALRIEQGTLWITDPLSPTGAKMSLVELTEISIDSDSANAASQAATGVQRFSTRLTAEAEPLFNFVYPPGTEFAELTVTPDAHQGDA